MVPPIPQAAWAAPSSTNSGPAMNLGLASNVKYQLENGKTYTLSNANVTNTVIEVPSGRTATVVVPKNVTVTINDYGNGCSPISLLGSGKLNLVVDGTLTVTGGAATNGTGHPINNTNTEINKGKGGYAGISVPVGTTLTVRGGGTLLARGGDAGNGGEQIRDPYGTNTDCGGGGGGGAGAGIGGNGGDGGSYGTTVGRPGIGAGTIAIYETVKVTAYGGGGGSGNPATNATSGGGAGGYPAAGIGGGGSGGGNGTSGNGGGGFSGGGGEDANYQGVNSGKGGTNGTGGKGGMQSAGGNGSMGIGGGGYYSRGTGRNTTALTGGIIAGGAGGYDGSDANVGSNGGAGGTVYLGNKASLTVANGSLISTTKQKWGQSPAFIYRQYGYETAAIRGATALTSVNTSSESTFLSSLASIAKKDNGISKKGVGSGAGYTESSNGSFTTQKVPERVALATMYERNTYYFGQ